MNAMNDNIQDQSDTMDDEAVARLIQTAGRRPAVPEWDAAVVKAAAKKRWRLKVEQQGAAHTNETHTNEAHDHAAPMRARGASPNRSLYWRAGGLLAAAAAMFVALGLRFMMPTDVATLERGTIAAFRGDSPRTSLNLGDVLKSGTVVETSNSAAAPARAALKLSGGASLRLDANSRLRLVSSSAMELEQGTVYVDSGPGAEAVVIRTSLGVAREIGTQFEVRLHAANDDGDDDDDLRIRVREGLVDLEQGGESHRAAAGEELTIKADGTVTRGVVPVQGAEWDWALAIAPAFDSEQRTLGELLEWAAREGGWKLEFADGAEAAAAESILNGFEVIEAQELQTKVDLAILSTGLNCRFEAGTIFVTSP